MNRNFEVWLHPFMGDCRYFASDELTPDNRATLCNAGYYCKHTFKASDKAEADTRFAAWVNAVFPASGNLRE